jgi:hypothetical protein
LRWERSFMMAIRPGVRKGMIVCAGLALAAALVVGAGGCSKPGEGTVHVGPQARERIGRGSGAQTPVGSKAVAEPSTIKSRIQRDVEVK